MNLSTLIVLSVVLLIIGLDIYYLMKNGIGSCSGNCGDGCHSSCKWVGDIKKARKSIQFRNKLKAFFGIAK